MDEGADSVALASPLAVARGTIEGMIIGPDEPPRGTHGFGYDPLFLVPGLGQTTAQLTPSHKNAISHRSDAAGKMWVEVRKLFEAKVLT